MEIERKFLIKNLPASLDRYTGTELEQGYLCTNPVVRVRREGEEYYMTYKGGGMLKRVEHNLPLTKEGYEHLVKKSDGRIIKKTRYLIPVKDIDMWNESYEPEKLTHADVGDGRVIELDVFHGDYEGLWLAEIEFSSEEQANAFVMPEIFKEDVTMDGRYHNSNLSKR